MRGKKYIDADALKDAVRDWFDSPSIVKDIEFLIDDMPAVDFKQSKHDRSYIRKDAVIKLIESM